MGDRRLKMFYGEHGQANEIKIDLSSLEISNKRLPHGKISPSGKGRRFYPVSEPATRMYLKIWAMTRIVTKFLKTAIPKTL